MISKIMQGAPSKKFSNSWRMAKRLELIEEWLSSHREITFKHIQRTGNKVANLLANIRVNCELELRSGPISSLVSEAQLMEFNNLVKNDLKQGEENRPDAGDLRSY